MPKITGPSKEKLTLGITPKNMKNIAIVMANNEYSTITDLVNDALTYWFENRNQNQDDMMAKFLQSPKGKDIIIACIQHYDVEKKEQEMKKQ